MGEILACLAPGLVFAASVVFWLTVFVFFVRYLTDFRGRW